MAANSHGVIYAAIACNQRISVIKFVSAAAADRSTMLAGKSGGLLLGERVDREQILQLEKTIFADAEVENVGQLLTMQLDQDNVLLIAVVRFERHLNLDQGEQVIARWEPAIKKKCPAIRHMVLESGALRPPHREPA